MVGYDKHQEEDKYNNDRIKMKYDKPTLVIHMGCAWENFTPQDLEQKGCGGSEWHAHRIAQELSKQGFRVVVFGPMEPQFYKDVEYRNDWERWREQNYIDYLLVERYTQFFQGARAGKKFLQIHDVFAMDQQGPKVKDIYSELDGILVLSTWHKSFVMDYHKIPADKIIITANGVD
jgi:hypothetical protein